MFSLPFWMFLHYRRNGRLLRSTPRLVMLTVTTLMFALGLIALVLQTTLSYQQFAQLFNSSSSSLWSTYRTSVVTAVVATIARIIVSNAFTFDIRRLSNYPSKQYILSEVVCAWRAAVLWDYDRRVVAVLTVFLIGATCESPHFSDKPRLLSLISAAAGVNLGRTLHPIFVSQTTTDSGTKLGETALIMIGPLLATNILSTALIGIKAWWVSTVPRCHIYVSKGCLGNIGAYC